MRACGACVCVRACTCVYMYMRVLCVEEVCGITVYITANVMQSFTNHTQSVGADERFDTE